MDRTDYLAVFGEPGTNNEWVREYLQQLRDNWKLAEVSLARAMLLIAALSAAFVLLADQGVSEFSIGGVKVSNLAAVQAGVPVVVAYLCLTMTQYAALAYRISYLHDGLCAYYWPRFFEQNLELALRPSNSLGSPELLVHSTDSRWLRAMLRGVGVIRYLAYGLAPPLLLICEVVWLWLHSSLDGLVLGGVTAISVVLLIAAIPNLALLAQNLAWDLRAEPQPHQVR